MLDAQRWVNATYGSFAGYAACPENGKTGWATMRALTSGLQHELGITPLTGSVGPATFARLTERGEIRPGEPNGALVRIVQHALYCKGYPGGAAGGVFDGPTIGGLRALRQDAGLPGLADGVQPKVFRALLTMDAYVLTSGGSPAIRSIQQWFNQAYYTRAGFFIVPCDGHYSRDVQQALMKALQYAFGVPDESANGLFGEATRAGLRRSPLGPGSGGLLVRLFSAACVFNGKARFRTDKGDWKYREATFTDHYGTVLIDYVRAFQEFSLLEKTGRADYATWAQLLVSFGDSERRTAACDTSTPLTAARARALADAGYALVGRYLDNAPGGRNKKIQPGEPAAIFAAGLRVFPIWQYGARDLGDFTYATGREHGDLAHRSAAGHGFGRGTVIYFAVDYDATDEEITSNIVPYFHGVQASLASRGRRYVAGVYGSRNVCSRVSGATFTAFSFVSGMSYRFSGNLGFPLPENWAFNQIKEFSFGSGADAFPLDNDVHQPHSDPGAASVGGTADPLTDYLRFIDELYAVAQRYGDAPSRCVLEYLRYPVYTKPGEGWTELIGDVDRAWIRYAEQHAPPRVARYSDPSLGITVEAGHFGATANGVLLKGDGPGVRAAGRGDFAGWGGDLSSFYGEWRRESDAYASGYAFCQARLARPDVESSFPLNDLVEDVDAHLVAWETRRGTPVNVAIRSHLESGHRTRFTRFFEQRYGGSTAGVLSAAHAMLTTNDDKDLSVIRAGVMAKAAGGTLLLPQQLPAEKLTPFLEGYADVLHRLVQQE